ncbi:hypothetical protein L0Z36_14040 [Burkholderia multivorans]|uniref:hypothetical protein n=1 Tax=Burkholderia multivorans TaxID=87883 RepID=UPI00201A103C|nr:hypothetical protein [Burkholderia multivorans]UQP00004.1 hypothetical protein L0Z36_14040 [Burkholderia multivorans]
MHTIIIDLPYIRIGAHEAWIERVSPRGPWLGIDPHEAGTTLTIAWWVIQYSRVSA